MRCLLLYAGTPIGRVELDDGEPAGGYLEPLPAYEKVGPIFRVAGDALWLARFDADSPLYRELWVGTPIEDAQAVLPHLSLATEAGTPIPVASLDFWDASLDGEPPFVLAYLRPQPAAVPARAPLPPTAGGDSRPAA